MPVFNRELENEEKEVVGLRGYPPNIHQVFCLKCYKKGKVKRLEDNLSQCIQRIETQDKTKIFICDGCGSRLD